ncbi:alanyl-tRNA synthetase [Candidatus Endolissoclinum faulkneri L2]|uniref:Alanine--tRNA ligase n=1 Tax=Candidatus Endolissoclinum faulkneri L2 TaxID=1193729 RepID=K7YNL8_9PROT|nr:alanine--tRNA ligase [Candidatus Endolissoclinum faulkneri]AFX99127.1 alanyl-tRNA synthetase [Candidatus Endolissoclinum faulkneri L2]
MATSKDIRRAFLDYFNHHQHLEVASSSLVPHNDSTLMFTNSGMIQFKSLFTGEETSEYTRVTTSQKCMRAGGKHNDLDNVGYTARHHTFFEMLGNFSFGDYFKAEAIEYAWKMITNELGLSKDKLLATVYAEDDEAAKLWNKITGLPEQKIICIPTSDNFWAMGDTGPCGPCSEIFFDHGPSFSGDLPGRSNGNGDRFIEIWNLVFMQYEQVSQEERVDLPRPSIDTGMGLERITAVLQGKHDNYEIDTMRHIIEASADISGADPDGKFKVSHRIIADHLRASIFLIADGVLPSSEGRGYVLRRIMRRAMRHIHIMGCTDPIMYRLVSTIVKDMGEAFPELVRASALATETIKMEEIKFKETLDRGLSLLSDETNKLGFGQPLSGEFAFKLYDTYGFPLDLTSDILRGQGRSLDQAGFDLAMAGQRAAARKSWFGLVEAAPDLIWSQVRKDVGATKFLGYDKTSINAVICSLIVDNKQVSSIHSGIDVLVVVNQTSFYAESGGQIGDTGIMRTSSGATLTVTDTKKKFGDLFVHVAISNSGIIKIGDSVEMLVDIDRRDRVRANHSATHLLHEALRRRLGCEVAQKGSLVTPDRIRFDFTQPTAITNGDLLWIESEVNRRVFQNSSVITRQMTLESALTEGSTVLFGKKYGEKVRVVSMGGKIESDNRFAWSVECCGGIHVKRTGDIGIVKIISEMAISAGVRRIEAVTAMGALNWINSHEKIITKVAAELKSTPEKLPARTHALIQEVHQLKRDLVKSRKQLAFGGGITKNVCGITFTIRLLDAVPACELKSIADGLKQQIGSGVVAIISNNNGKSSLVVAVTNDLVDRFSAIDLVRAASFAIGGKGGGGRLDMAQAAGGYNIIDSNNKVIAAIEEALASLYPSPIL